MTPRRSRRSATGPSTGSCPTSRSGSRRSKATRIRLAVLLGVFLVACMPSVSTPSATPTVIATAAATSSPTSTIAATSTPNVPGFPQRSVVTFYRTEDVIRGSAQPSKRLDVSVPLYQMTFGPDPRWAIVSNVADPSRLRLLDLGSGNVESFALGLPSDALNMRSLVRWLPDGRLLLTGREISVGGPRGEDLRSVFATFSLDVVHRGRDSCSRSGRWTATRSWSSISRPV